ncbi:MAG TPA: hypothetical protein DCY40_03740 [Actinobacteria bacterium]|nr:hypothetical protein [Actinomycetota bacterium]
MVATLAAALLIVSAALAAEPTVPLGNADPFAVLAGETITNTGATTITGDVGLHPGPAVAGFGPGADQVTLVPPSALHVADAVALAAKNALVTAYNDAAGRDVTATIATELGGATLPGGVYNSDAGTFQITGTLTLDGENDPNAVWIFQMESTLLATGSSNVAFIRAADACNVFWQVGSSAVIEPGATFSGNILALTSISLQTGATLYGRALARNGSVTMDTNTITRAVCLPDVGPGTGGGSTSGTEDAHLFILAGGLFAVAIGVLAMRRRASRSN